jgi:hypothetical protein
VPTADIVTLGRHVRKCQERTSSRPVGMSENVRALRHQMIPFHKMQFSCTGRNPL